MTQSKRKQLTKNQRLEVYNKYGGRCAYCGKPIELSNMQVDHIESVYAHNGKSEIENYNPACRECNFYKSTFSVEDFRKRIKDIMKGLKRLFIFNLAVKYGMIEANDKSIKFYYEIVEENKVKEDTE